MSELEKLKKLESKKNICITGIFFGLIGSGVSFGVSVHTKEDNKKIFSVLLLIISIIILIISIICIIDINKQITKAPSIYNSLLNKYKSKRGWSKENIKAAINAIVNEMKKVRIRNHRKIKNKKGYTISTYNEANIRKFLESPNTHNSIIYNILLDLDNQLKLNPFSKELKEPKVKPSIPNELETKTYH
jgi:hypothetical protein